MVPGIAISVLARASEPLRAPAPQLCCTACLLGLLLLPSKLSSVVDLRRGCRDLAAEGVAIPLPLPKRSRVAQPQQRPAARPVHLSLQPGRPRSQHAWHSLPAAASPASAVQQTRLRELAAAQTPFSPYCAPAAVRAAFAAGASLPHSQAGLGQVQQLQPSRLGLPAGHQTPRTTPYGRTSQYLAFTPDMTEPAQQADSTPQVPAQLSGPDLPAAPTCTLHADSQMRGLTMLAACCAAVMQAVCRMSTTSWLLH